MNALISVDDALTLLKQHACRPESESVPLSQAFGQRLANPVVARTTLPPSDVSSMDGYAVRLEDVRQAGATLKLVGEVAAGAIPPRSIDPGETMRIFTGAAVPNGADHILIQEEARPSENTIEVLVDQAPAGYIRKAGIDFSEGDLLVRAGSILGPAELAIAAASNHRELMIVRPQRVAIIAGGNELRPPGSDLQPGQVINSVSTALSALVRCWGGHPIEVGIAKDEVGSIRQLIEAAHDADIIVPVGGASVGDHDHTKAAFLDAGAEFVFSKIAVKPGKPTWFARLGEKSVLGLPGNPASAYVCAHLFLRPMMTPPSEATTPFTAKLEAAIPANGMRETFLRAQTVKTKSGVCVTALPNQDSSLLHPFLVADCLVRRQAGAPAAFPGDIVDCVPLSVTATGA